MASSGLRENVILIKIILTPQMASKLCVKGDMVLRGDSIPQGRTILTSDVDVNSVPLLMVVEGVWPIVGWEQQVIT